MGRGDKPEPEDEEEEKEPVDPNAPVETPENPDA